ncbi:C2 domain-containing protein At1g53590 isoform X2 [Jatropha curcas]|uniref:C2 domain-containing protein At1g53590 isoform X2 n=1 Tax=Jatropha curcas TaxID=180498 RepID=UPI0005FB1748|nr:C2 domain-containing protein At1g53590 isoform X2 [Jatropha curcas]
MDITEVSIIHHVGIVLLLLWLLSLFNQCHPVAYFISLIYLFAVHERYVMRLKRKLQFHERKQANQKRMLSDSETVRWLNHAVEKIWPICLEQIVSQKILLPIIPWFLDKYKPWTAKKAVVQHMYLGRNPPIFTEMRVLGQCASDDHLALELGMNFCTADDMSAVLAVKLRRRLGFGMWAKLHMTAMHVEGKPNMLVVDVEKFASTQPGDLTESWFSVDEKEPIAYAIVEVVEASDVKPSDLNGLADPYVKGQLGPYKFRTKIQRKTLAPKWHEEFKIPISTWESANVLAIEVRDKDHFVDDSLGHCTISINDLRDGERHDMWLPLQNIKMGRLHLAITVLEENMKGVTNIFNGETLSKEEIQDSFVSEIGNRTSFPSSTSDKFHSVDNFEPINVEGQQGTGIWVHQPGSEVSQKWEPRKSKSGNLDNQTQGVHDDSVGDTHSTGPGSFNNDSSSADENAEGKNRMNKVRQGLRKISSVFHRSPKNEDSLGSSGETVKSPYANIKAVNQKEIGVNFIVEDRLSGTTMNKNLKEVNSSPEGSGPESPGKGNVKDMAKGILKHAEKSARTIKHVLSRKGSRKSRGNPSDVTELEIYPGSDSSDDESLTPSQVQRIPIVSSSTHSHFANDDSDKTWESGVQAGSSEFVKDTEGQMKKVNVEVLERIEETR